MLDIILQILGILGITLLILVCILLVALLLILFFPITYRVSGDKSSEALTFQIKLNWLFGLLRGRYFYPEPGKFTVKLLWITLFDSGSQKESEDENEDSSLPDSKQPSEENDNRDFNDENITLDSFIDSSDKLYSGDKTQKEPKKKGFAEFIIEKYDKIKYTIHKTYDKIKHILENITFYKELFREKETQELLQHALERLKKIWENIHPRILKANITFGTGSPDTTGYALGIYGMFSPMLGEHINITSDFTQAILLGDFYAAGHITVFQVLFHSLKVIFDKRLQQLNEEIKKHRNQ